MRVRLGVALLTGSLLLALAANALAAVPTASGPAHLEGLVQVDQSQRGAPVVEFSADSTDGTGYHLDTTLSVVQLQSQQRSRGENERGENGSRTLGLSGT